MKIVALLLLQILPSIALAQSFVGSGDWCLVLDEIQNCSFKNADDCYAAAGTNGGYCLLNARKRLVQGSADWCLASATGRSCTYFSQRQCLQAAVSVEGGCVPNTEKALERAMELNEFGGLFGSESADTGDSNSLEDLGDRLQQAQQEIQNAQQAGQ